MHFKNRHDAGTQLCSKLLFLKGKNALVLGIARGGVIVGSVIAECIDAELDVIVPRKLGAPYNPELAIGAVMHDNRSYLNNSIIEMLRISQEYIKHAIEEKGKESKEMLIRYRGNDKYNISGRHVVIVDDGIATGATVIVSILWCKEHSPASITLAVPVMPRDIYNRLSSMVDNLVAILTPIDFGAVGEFYDRFDPVSDEEVILALARR
jgi:putative phosphoribosyl transferase